MEMESPEYRRNFSIYNLWTDICKLQIHIHNLQTHIHKLQTENLSAGFGKLPDIVMASVHK